MPAKINVLHSAAGIHATIVEPLGWVVEFVLFVWRAVKHTKSASGTESRGFP